MPFPTTTSPRAKPVTGSEDVTAIAKAPVTGAMASLLMATVGVVVSASTQFSSASAPVSSASSASRSAGSTVSPGLELDRSTVPTMLREGMMVIELPWPRTKQPALPDLFGTARLAGTGRSRMA